MVLDETDANNNFELTVTKPNSINRSQQPAHHAPPPPRPAPPKQHIPIEEDETPAPAIPETADFFNLKQDPAETNVAPPMSKQESFDLLGGFSEPVKTAENKPISNPMPDLLGKCFLFIHIIQ
jgi:hypothetical protein